MTCHMSVLCLVCHSAVPSPSWCVQVVRNVLTVDYHMSRYKTVVEELQRDPLPLSPSSLLLSSSACVSIIKDCRD